MKILLTLTILLLANTGYAKTPTEIYYENIDGIVEVSTGNSTATGFYIRPHYIVTNAHAVDGGMIEGMGTVNVTIHSRSKTDTGMVLATFPRYDMAIVYTPQIIGDPLKIDTRRLLVGEEIVSIGNPAGEVNSLAVGHIANNNRRVSLVPEFVSYQLDLTGVGGSSGSPIMDMDGNVVALLNAGLYGADSIIFAIPTIEIFSMINLIIEGHHRGYVR